MTLRQDGNKVADWVSFVKLNMKSKTSLSKSELGWFPFLRQDLVHICNCLVVFQWFVSLIRLYVGLQFKTWAEVMKYAELQVA